MPLPEKRQCSRCGDPKPIGDFYPRNSQAKPEKLSDLVTICKLCNTERQRIGKQRRRVRQLTPDQLLEEVRRAHQWMDELTAEQMRRGVEGEVHYEMAGAGVPEAGALPRAEG